MPVKISTQASFAHTPPTSSVVGLSDLYNGENLFGRNYFISSEGDSGFSKSVTISYTDFLSYIITPITDPTNANYINPAKLALRFFHSYNSTTYAWFLTVATCEMGTPDPSTPLLYPLTERGSRFQLINGSTPRVSTLAGSYDPSYFDAFYDSAGNPLNPVNTHIKSLVFPWQNEVLAMYNQNTPLLTPGQTAYLQFECCSFYIAQPSTYSNVPYPHGIVIYLHCNGSDLLDNGTYASMFYNHGADFATMCPPDPHCPYYVFPPDIHPLRISNFKKREKSN
ncbi:MAG: hypothetical protein P4L41_13120 [Flavipsychrobacter sp.]|nr:hypothetical protein [Flavipsychrobacter sp.]